MLEQPLLRPSPAIGRLQIEPRNLTVADLLAVFAGISLSLALVPDDVRRLFEPAVWDRDRLPQPQSILLMVFLFGSWIIVCICAAIVPAVVWRCARYRRMPTAGEWLAILLLLVSPLVRIDRLAYMPTEWIYRRLDTSHPLAHFIGAGSNRQPVTGLMIAGALACLAGVGLLGPMRRLHPLFKSCWIVLLLILYLGLPARYRDWSWTSYYQVYHIPLWNAESWREFEFLSVVVLTHPLIWLPVAVTLGLLIQSFFCGSLGRWRWTEWAGLVMLLGTLSLIVLLLQHSDVVFIKFGWLVVAPAVGIVLSWPIGWCWRRWWSDNQMEMQRGKLT